MRHNDQLSMYTSHYPAGMDYQAINTTLTFSVSMPTQVVTIPILDDQIVEAYYNSHENFSVTLTTIDPAVTLNMQSATVYIRGNDSKLWAKYLWVLYVYCLWLHVTLIVSHAFSNFSSRCYNWIQQHSDFCK